MAEDDELHVSTALISGFLGSLWCVRKSLDWLKGPTLIGEILVGIVWGPEGLDLLSHWELVSILGM
jgi:hypothetical protein